ncbi:MAG: nucleoside-diphosphate sugar epimerase/dehydratase [Syntrophales bacterium]|nr:nucleoside-diphosphate sugar epimerase/dehydratase [Syntrophales bacterium]
MKRVILNKHFYYLVLADAVLIVLAYILAFMLRFEGSIPPENIAGFYRVLYYVVPLKLFFFFFFNLYKGMWRYTSLIDLINVLKACVVSTITLMVVCTIGHNFQGYSRSAFIIDLVMTIFLIGGLRVGVRLFMSGNLPTFWSFVRYQDPAMKKLIIIGAGAAGEKVLREMMDNQVLKMEPVGFLDDDRSKHGKSIHGVPVIGGVDELLKVTLEYDEILIAIPSARGEQMRRIVNLCERSGKRYRTMPSLGEIINGRISLKAIREVRLEDILGREEVHLDRDNIRKFLKGRRILVTGAGGSIGSELVRQIGHYQPDQLALLDFSEYNLFQAEMECRQHFDGITVKSYLVDIRDRQSLERAFVDFQPQVIFHAAAYKHVPLQELNPWEAVRNNVSGTWNVALTSVKSGAERFVLVSTDKAVRPTNVMGATKRIAEMLILSMNRGENLSACENGTRFMAVRFGNVLGSSGSVVPIFQQQIAHGHPITVTHPDVTRYFMTIPEAAQLILQAGTMGEGGEIFILDMGKPVRIDDMARDLIRLHGLEPDRDVPIQYIGLRPGEKLYEELITEGEGIVKTSHEKIRVIHGRFNHYDALSGPIDKLVSMADTYNSSAIKQKIQEIVPEYCPQTEE